MINEIYITYKMKITEYKSFILLRVANKFHQEIYLAVRGNIQNKITASELQFIFDEIDKNKLMIVKSGETFFEIVTFTKDRSYFIFDFSGRID